MPVTCHSHATHMPLTEYPSVHSLQGEELAGEFPTEGRLEHDGWGAADAHDPIKLINNCK